MKKRILLAAVALAIPLLLANSAWATGVNITATAVCDPAGAPVIQYTASAWDTTSIYAANSEIDILFNNVKVGQGVFNALNGYTFSGSAPSPGGTSVVVTAVAVGLWYGRWDAGQSASVTVTVPTDCVETGFGRFTGGGTQIRVGPARVSRGLTIHCDLLLSNNLEVNWGGSNSFHMTEHLTTVACTDDPDIIQAPPVAPLDTLIGVGIGKFNSNLSDYTIEFTLVDAGEPGGNDKMAIKIYETLNPANVVLNVPLQLLSTGNLQAHYDQPHK